MNKEILKVYVDSKEQKKTIKKYYAFFKQKGIEPEKQILGDYGDVALFLTCKQWLNIERKTYSDFVTSYISGHIQDQASRMNKVSDNYCVIVYGSISDLKKLYRKYPAVKHIKQTSVDKMVRTLMMIYKCPVFFVDNEAQYFQEIMRIAETINKKGNESLQKKPVSVLKNRKDVEIIMGANRIGEKTALTLLNAFKTPEKVFNASREELLKINGIGDATIADLKAWRSVYYNGI